MLNAAAREENAQSARILFVHVCCVEHGMRL